MVSTKVAFGALAVACVTAAGVGAYLASRQNADSLAAGIAVSTPAKPDATTPAAPSVAETEAVIDDAKKTAPPTVAEAADVAVPTPKTESPSSRATPRAPRTAAQTRPATSAPRAVQAPAPTAKAPSVAPGDTSRSLPPSAPANSEPDPNAASARPFEPAPAPVESAASASSRVPQRTFEELVVSPDSVIGLQIETTLTSERAKIEDRVEARVTRDVKVGDRVAIPAGSRMMGSVTQVERGGKVREQARLAVRFHTLVLADGSEVPVSTDTLYREGTAPTKESAAKIGGAAVGGAILGAILGGGKGAATGAAVGAAGGTAAVMAGDRNPAVLSAGSNVTVRVLSPVTITIEKE